MLALVEPVPARSCAANQLAVLFEGGGWPAFIEADSVAAAALPRARELFADQELALVDDDQVVAAGWGVPLSWDGMAEHLPAGYSETLQRVLAHHDRRLMRNTFVLCAVQVRSDLGRRGLAGTAVKALVEHATTHGSIHRTTATNSETPPNGHGIPLGGPSPRRSEVGYSAPGLVPGQEHAVGKRPGLHQVQVHPVVQGREERRAAAHQDRVGDDRVLLISPARMAAAARVAPPTSVGPSSSVLSRVISLTASPVTRRAFQSNANSSSLGTLQPRSSPGAAM